MYKPGGKVTKKEELLEAKNKLEAIISDSKCNPILVRLAWHDSGTYVSSPIYLPIESLLPQSMSSKDAAASMHFLLSFDIQKRLEGI